MDQHPLGDAPYCQEQMWPDAGYEYLCTRGAGHPGSHMAASPTGTVAIWDESFHWTNREGWL